MTGRPDRVRRLAAADAGLPDETAAAHARAGAAADPEAAAVLDALAATRADLAALPAPPVPGDVAARWDAALAAAAQDPPSPPRESQVPTPRAVPLDGTGRPSPRPAPGAPPRVRPPARARRGERVPGAGARRRRALLLAGAAVLAVAVAATGLLTGPERPVAVSRVELAAAATAAIGVRDLGPLVDPARRAACFAAAGVGPVQPARVLGGRGVVLDGAPGTLLVLATGELGVLRIVVVDPACGADGRGTLLAETVTR